MQTSLFTYPELIELLRRNMPAVLASVIRTQGSTPQKAGSSALIGSGQLLAGTVGGGTTELKVIQEARAALQSKKPKLFSFDLHGELSKGSDSICGGSMVVLLDATPEKHIEVFSRLGKSLEQHIPGVLMTWIDKSNPEKIDINRYWVTREKEFFFRGELGLAVDIVISGMLEDPRTLCQTIEVVNPETNSDDLVFLECLIPKPSLIIAGAGHIGRSLAHLGKFLGFEVTVWDDREEYASKTQIPDADFVWSGPIDTVLEKMKLSDDSYLVVVTHGHKNDAEVLRKFISKPSAYLGMIGSKAKVSQMKTEFIAKGWATPEQWKRIFAPVGLSIGGQTVEEIALSIAAQLVQVRNERNKTGE